MTNTSSASDDDGAKLNTLAVLCLSLLTSILPAFFIYEYSGIGRGLETAQESIAATDDAVEALAIVGIVVLVSSLFDLKIWYPQGILMATFSTIIALVTVLALLSMTGTNPYLPICIFSVAVPLLLVGLKNLLFRKVPTVVFLNKTSVILVFVGCICACIFLAWIILPMIYPNSPIIDPTGYGNEWDPETRAIYAYRAGCEANFEDLSHCKNAVSGEPCFFNADGTVHFSISCRSHCLAVYEEECPIPFMVWVNPGLAALSLIVMGFIAKFLSPNNVMNEKVLTVVKSSAVFLFLFWIFASLAGAGDGLSGSLIAFALSMFVGTSIIIAPVALSNLSNTDSDIVGKAMESNTYYMDIIKGFVILAFSPLLPVYLILSALTQMLRKAKSFVTRVPLEYKGYLTQTGAAGLNDLRNWNHSKVISYAVYWGFGYVFFNVLASKFTTVFLSWLIEFTSEMNILSVTGIVTAVGLGLFMLPPIPGLPIYLTGGIVLVSVGWETMGLVYAITYATCVSLGIKLLACAIQQKIIGGMLGGFISVKQMVAINSDGIRAMRLILSEEGITARKIAVLVGGPDWPVSVLCGILGLDLLPILYGTLPVILVIMPTVLTGSFAFMGSLETNDGMDKYPWADTMGTVSSALAACVLFYFAFAAAGAVSSTLSNDKEELAKLEYDKEVEAADAEVSKLDAVRERVTVWSNVPIVYKLSLIASFLSMVACCYLLVLFSEQSFKDYDLLYTINEHLGGNWTNLVKPLGRVALLLCVVSYIFFSFFNSWANRETRKIYDASNAAELEPLAQSAVSHGFYV